MKWVVAQIYKKSNLAFYNVNRKTEDSTEEPESPLSTIYVKLYQS